MPTFKAELSKSSIDKLIQDIKGYQKDLNAKCKLFAERLAEKGLFMAQSKANESVLAKYLTFEKKDESTGNTTKIMLVGKGETFVSDEYNDFNTLLAVEFGAGIKYNPEPNLLSAEMGYGVGTFPGQVHAFDPEGWYYWSEEKQQWVHSYGIEATMPMWNASQEMRQQITQVAREVFGK